jgi:hypothetical protein
VGELKGNPYTPDWCGHAWSPEQAVKVALGELPATAQGLYRIKRPGDQTSLTYIGQGQVRERLAAHVHKAVLPKHRQASFFAGQLMCSWVVNESWCAHQRLELENDLIAAHVLATGAVPQAQFIG